MGGIIFLKPSRKIELEYQYKSNRLQEYGIFGPTAQSSNHHPFKHTSTLIEESVKIMPFELSALG